MRKFVIMSGAKNPETLEFIDSSLSLRMIKMLIFAFKH